MSDEQKDLNIEHQISVEVIRKGDKRNDEIIGESDREIISEQDSRS